MTSDELPPDAFARWLTQMSRALGYPRDADLARALGLPQSTISRWRRGSRPAVSHLAKVAQVLRTELEPLLVLTGHISQNVPLGQLATPPEPLSYLSETDRKIEESDVPEAMKEVLRAYWDQRMREERTRMDALINQFSEKPAKNRGDMKDWLVNSYKSALAEHVTVAFMELVDLEMQRIRERRQSGGE